MKDLIKIEKSSINGSEVNSVNSREVYEHLDISTPYSMWIRRAIEKYKFIENEDFTVNKIVIRNNAHLDYIVTIDMAKELCMVSNSDKGRETRKYFIEVEKIANKPMTIEQLIQENIKVIGQLQTKVITLQNKVEEDKPKVRFAEAISGTVSNIDFETFAKALYDSEGIKMGRNNLMKWFRDNRYLMKNNKPYQTMLDRGLMTLKEGSYINQSTQEMVTYTQPRITGKGQMYFTNKLLDEAK
jgi:anti-repressor protein